MPIWQFILKKFGKKSAFAAGMIVRNIAQTCKTETRYIIHTCKETKDTWNVQLKKQKCMTHTCKKTKNYVESDCKKHDTYMYDIMEQFRE